jgi:hypothetical protein
MRQSRTVPLVLFSFLALIILAAASLPAATDLPERGQGRGPVERFDGDHLTLELPTRFEQARLEVSGPGRVGRQLTFRAGQEITFPLVRANGAPLPSGMYRYTLRLSPPPDKGAAFFVGAFFIEDGIAVSRSAKRSQLADIREGLNERRDQFKARRQKLAQRPQDLGERAGATPQGGPPPILPYLTLDSAFPCLYFVDTSYGYDGSVCGYYGNLYRFAEYANYDFGVRNLRYGFLNRDYGFYNVRFSPYWNIDIARAVNSLVSGYPYTYGEKGPIGPYEGYGWIVSYSSTANPYGFAYGYSLIGAGHFNYVGPPFYYIYYGSYVSANYYGVGVNTVYPTADLTVTDYYPRSTGNGFAAMRLYSYQSGVQWAFSATPAGDVTVNKIGTGGQEFTVRERLDAEGPTMEVQGSLKATNVIFPSSRSLKTDFAALDAKEVLAKLLEVPVMSWRFKTEDRSARHFGPVAEDFHAAFRLGNDKMITTVDTNGVALAAIQGLQEVVKENRAELTALLEQKDSEIVDLRRRLAALEQRLREPAPGG